MQLLLYSILYIKKTEKKPFFLAINNFIFFLTKKKVINKIDSNK